MVLRNEKERNNGPLCRVRNRIIFYGADSQGPKPPIWRRAWRINSRYYAGQFHTTHTGKDREGKAAMLWLKAAHLIAVICWFAGIFYLPRILVYYAQSEDSATRVQLALMAHKLYRFMTPIAVVAVLLGFALAAFNPAYYLAAKWLWLKLLAVAGLAIYHAICGRYVAAVRADSNRHSSLYFRWFNEIPVLFLLVIVVLTVVKPL